MLWTVVRPAALAHGHGPGLSGLPALSVILGKSLARCVWGHGGDKAKIIQSQALELIMLHGRRCVVSITRHPPRAATPMA